MKISRIAEYLLVIFLTLKLTGLVDWSWWYITAPLWGYAITALTFGFIFGFVEAGKKRSKVSDIKIKANVDQYLKDMEKGKGGSEV